eukprot:TRINITY_DN8189_c0_g1_i5.p1 TRINITY_DN8189_c0_g1~~TRINITY_DN8189_c0_g1_i5.p1  ORF type:complete len:274 (+),score=25.72 TRINITY_DN8189_c0_g1_i5:41-862(+)
MEFKLGEIIHSGSTASIVQVLVTGISASIVLKKGHDLESEQYIAREKSILKYLIHKNIIRSYDIGSSGLVLERKSSDLFDFLQRKGALSERFVKKVIRQLLMGLNYSHEMGIAHRDVKLENVLIDESAESVVLCDFGYSIHFDSLTMDNDVVGTSVYRSPEILRNAIRPNSTECRTGFEIPASDIFAVGVMMFILLTGSYPWNGNDHQLYNQTINASRLPRRVTHLSASGKSFMRHLLLKDPLSRPTVAEALNSEWFVGEEVVAIQRWFRRYR